MFLLNPLRRALGKPTIVRRERTNDGTTVWFSDDSMEMTGGVAGRVARGLRNAHSTEAVRTIRDVARRFEEG